MKPAKRLAHRVVAGQAFVMDPAKETLHSFNETGTFVWKGLAAGRSEEELVRGLMEAFEVEEARARADVGALVARLREEGLVE